MITMNSKMIKAYSNLSKHSIELDRGLREIAESGFSSKNGCFLIRKCAEIDTNAKINDFPDKTGYECFINSVNIDDYIESFYLEQGIRFVRSVFNHWNESNGNRKLIAILLMDELTFKVKFHVQRSGERWLADDLEDYEESLMMVDSSEPEFR
ncbi:hypothetical protein [Vreelandella utahensis]|uniref:hypothetical protein n=1 Tax=Vreelandella halophila TaxID=86177 RepID=UPI00098724D1|nr:hypothetical protein [Halomonas utahensis]